MLTQSILGSVHSVPFTHSSTSLSQSVPSQPTEHWQPVEYIQVSTRCTPHISS